MPREVFDFEQKLNIDKGWLIIIIGAFCTVSFSLGVFLRELILAVIS